MTGKTRKALAAALAAGVLGAAGCANGPGLQESFQNVNNNNSWPERNGALARQTVLHPFEVQQNNAAVVNDVILNAYFDNGTDALNGVGRDKLDQLARKMPAPNPVVWLQTANDVVYEAKAADRTVAGRNDLDQKRAAAVLAYLSSRPGCRGVGFNVQVLDNPDPTTNSTGPASAVRGLQTQYRSGITGSVGNGNVLGTGGGVASNTVGVAPTAGGAPQPGGGGSGPGTPGGGMGTGPGGLR
jgi:outer membrane protein OmpA-like peptidoglycan-associated protein